MKSYIAKNYSLRGFPRSFEAAKSAVISYSQFGEDLLLQNLLGFLETNLNYLDIGAYHPIRCSNTYLSYLKGGCGMAVEPNPEFRQAWRKYRGRDTLLSVAVSPSVNGHLYYHRHHTSPGLNFVAEEASANPEFQAARIECVSVVSLIQRYLEKFSKLDVLSIDCEGIDFELVQAFPFDRIRPKAILIEDFDPGCDSSIELLMRKQQYERWAQLRISKLFFDSRLGIKF